MCSACEKMDADVKRAAVHVAAHMANMYAMLGCRIGEIDIRRDPATRAARVTIQMSPPKPAEFIHFDFNIDVSAFGD